MLTVKHHKGHSGRSVFAWRVYRVTEAAPGRTITTQLGKYRTREQAEKALAFYQARDVQLSRDVQEMRAFEQLSR